MGYDGLGGFSRHCVIVRGDSPAETAQNLLTEGPSLLAELFPTAERLLRRLSSRNSPFNRNAASSIVPKTTRPITA